MVTGWSLKIEKDETMVTVLTGLLHQIERQRETRYRQLSHGQLNRTGELSQLSLRDKGGWSEVGEEAR